MALYLIVDYCRLLYLNRGLLGAQSTNLSTVRQVAR